MFGAWRWRRPPGSDVAGRAARRQRFCPPLHSGRPRSARPPYVAQRRAKPGEELEEAKIIRWSSHGFLFSPCSVITTRRSVSSMLARRGAVPMEDIYLCHQRIDNTRLRRNRSYACLIGLASALAVLGVVIWSFPRRTTRATKDPL